jgi:hypothetical protein
MRSRCSSEQVAISSVVECKVVQRKEEESLAEERNCGLIETRLRLTIGIRSGNTARIIAHAGSLKEGLGDSEELMITVHSP